MCVFSNRYKRESHGERDEPLFSLFLCLLHLAEMDRTISEEKQRERSLHLTEKYLREGSRRSNQIILTDNEMHLIAEFGLLIIPRGKLAYFHPTVTTMKRGRQICEERRYIKGDDYLHFSFRLFFSSSSSLYFSLSFSLALLMYLPISLDSHLPETTRNNEIRFSITRPTARLIGRGRKRKRENNRSRLRR